MQTRRATKIAVIGIVALLVVGFALTRSSVRDPRSRIEQEHGLHLPVSATFFESRGEAAIGFLDRGASSAFVIASDDLGSFIAQLKVQPGIATFVPGNSEYQLHAAWRTGKPTATYSCSSPVGDWLHVEVWPVDTGRVGIVLYTDWN